MLTLQLGAPSQGVGGRPKRLRWRGGREESVREPQRRSTLAALSPKRDLTSWELCGFSHSQGDCGHLVDSDP